MQTIIIASFQMEDFLDVSFLTHQLNILIQEESDILPTSSQITVALGIDITREIETADTTTEGVRFNI